MSKIHERAAHFFVDIYNKRDRTANLWMIKRTAYLVGLREWDEDPGIFADVDIDAQERFLCQVELQILMAYGHDYDPNKYQEDSRDEE